MTIYNEYTLCEVNRWIFLVLQSEISVETGYHHTGCLTADKMAMIFWLELFPTKLTIFIFFGYMSLFISQGILVTASQSTDNGYGYNTVTVVLLTEILKLITSILLYYRTNTIHSLVGNVIKNSKVLVLYFVPAFLYCLYNNLAFINLSIFDPTTYFLLLQFRVVITGILFQIIFKKYLSGKQWLSLVLLTIGCMCKQFNFGVSNNETENIGHNLNKFAKNTIGLDFSINAIYIIVQTVCSCLAGVYNEFLLKNQGSEVNIFIQNIFMYLDSIVCNAAILLIQGNLSNAFSINNLRPVFCVSVITIMINNAAIGIVTSFFLKYLNSILKTFASALELMFTAVLCYFLFAIPIYLNTILAISIVSGAVYLYSQNPVINTLESQTIHKSSFHDSENPLLQYENNSDLGEL